jgi:hypothetical protein
MFFGLNNYRFVLTKVYKKRGNTALLTKLLLNEL